MDPEFEKWALKSVNFRENKLTPDLIVNLTTGNAMTVSVAPSEKVCSKLE